MINLKNVDLPRKASIKTYSVILSTHDDNRLPEFEQPCKGAQLEILHMAEHSESFNSQE